MIGRLRGVVVERGGDGACVLEVGGVGYEVFVAPSDAARLPQPPEAVTLHVHTHVREDALVLFGFSRAEDRAAFRALLSVASVGPKLALAILSRLDASRLAAAVARRDAAAFKGIPGVGKKTVERVLIDLKDKLIAPAAPLSPALPAGIAVAPSASGPLQTVASALVGLGYKPAEAELALSRIADRVEDRTTEELLRDALASLA